jgi:hypothetical protein
MLNELVVAHFKVLYQRLTEGIGNVKLSIVIKVRLSLGLINHTIRSGDIPPQFLTSALDGDVASFMPPAVLPQENSPWYPLYKRVGGSQSHS